MQRDRSSELGDKIIAIRSALDFNLVKFAKGGKGRMKLEKPKDSEGLFVLLRDPFGTVPLYCYIDPVKNEILYADSVVELLKRGVPRKLSREGLFSYLAYGCLCAPYTMIEGVVSVPPGCKAVVEGGEIKIERHWTPSFETKPWRQDEAQEAVATELLRAVREQTESGNPAAFLSGGLDSSAIVALWRKQYAGEIRTYCVKHEDGKSEESRWARMVAEANHTRHTELLLEDRMICEWLDEAVASYDQPSCDGLNFWFATKLLKETADEKLMLSGEGGDELFMGYGQFIKHQLAYKYAPLMRHMPRFVGGMIDAFAPNEKFRKLAMLAGFKGEPYYIPRRIHTDWQIANVVNPDLRLPSAYPEETSSLLPHMELPGDLLNRISWLEMQTVVADMWMRDGFQTSEHNGISLRTPLCDVKLAELLYTIPGQMKCDSEISKPLLVRAAGDGIPDAVVHRPKQGFSLPFDRYFSGEVKDRIDEFLSGNTTKLFRPEVIRKVGRLYRDGKVYWNRVWLLFMAEDWCRRNKVEL